MINDYLNKQTIQDHYTIISIRWEMESRGWVQKTENRTEPKPKKPNRTKKSNRIEKIEPNRILLVRFGFGGLETEPNRTELIKLIFF